MQTAREERPRTAETENATSPNTLSSAETGRPERAGPPLAVVGLGKVGSVLRTVLGHFYPVSGFDIQTDSHWEPVLQAAAVFVCVQTPGGGDGRLDCSHVTDVLERLSQDGYHGVVAVRSTVSVGYMDEVCRRFPGLRLVYFPEFLRERSRLSWATNPDRLVIAGPTDAVDLILGLFDWVEDAPRMRLKTYRAAEIGKLAHNAYIATKVSFTNEIERISKEQGADPEEVMSVVSADRRVASREHLRPGLGPYEGSCVPKDTRELLSVAASPVLLAAVEEVNRQASARFRASRQSTTSPSPQLRSRSEERGP